MFDAAMLRPALALVFNACIWGLSWWPFRRLEGWGLHPLWTTALVYGLAMLAISVWRPAAWKQLVGTPALWLVLLAAGTTNAAFNWAVTIGDVVRVVLLFYLMPLWAVLLARLVLKEPLTRLALLRLLLALAGAALVLWPADAVDWPLPRSLADWLGLLGGFAFALSNVMLRHQKHAPEEGRALAMFCGGVLVASCIAALLGVVGQTAWPPVPQLPWTSLALVLALLFLLSNIALQYGAARLPANATAVIMLTEIVFASASAVALGAGRLTPGLAAGGLFVVLAALLAALDRPAHA